MLTSKCSKQTTKNPSSIFCVEKKKWLSFGDLSKCPRSTRTVIFPSSFTEQEKEWERKSGKTLYCQSCPQTIINRGTALAVPIWSKNLHLSLWIMQISNLISRTEQNKTPPVLLLCSNMAACSLGSNRITLPQGRNGGMRWWRQELRNVREACEPTRSVMLCRVI